LSAKAGCTSTEWFGIDGEVQPQVVHWGTICGCQLGARLELEVDANGRRGLLSQLKPQVGL
jgi:hypothetical protein